MNPNVPLYYAPVLELHHLIMTIPGGHRGQLEIEIDRIHLRRVGKLGLGGWVGGVSPAGGGDGGVSVTGSADLHIPPPEHSLKVHYEKAHYGPVSVRREASRVKGGQFVVVEGGLGIGRDADGSLVDRTEGVGGVDGQDNDGYIKLVRCKDTVAN